MIDLFAGAGGWDLAARALGYDVLGIELDGHAVATRRAAGLRTLQADVSTLDPLDHPAMTLLLASPPCQFFSASSPKRKIVSDKPYNVKRRTKWREYSAQGPNLVEEPMRWVREWRPEVVAFEQVPQVLPIWEKFADEMRKSFGYSTWTGVLNAADYGANQNRSRAFLLAARSGIVTPPIPQPRAVALYPTIVCNRRSKGGIVVGRSLQQGGVARAFDVAGSIQGFPIGYPWQGGVEAKSRQIGNAIPVQLAYAVLSALLEAKQEVA